MTWLKQIMEIDDTIDQMNSALRCSSLLNRNGCSLDSVLWLAFILLAFATPARALVIIPVWDSSITEDTNAATIESTINMAIHFYEARFAVPVTVSIQYEEMADGLGESQYEYVNIPYSQFLTALQNNATTSNATYALAHLPDGPNNPVNGDGNINVHIANLHALGLTEYTSGLPGGIVGRVLLNTSMMNLSRTNIDPAKYDLLSVAEHETDEVLALESDLNNLANSQDPFPQDLFRYTSAGARTFTTSGDEAYFSLDGTNLLVQFNQKSDGDYGDWWSYGPHIPRVQDAFATLGATPNPNVELIALDVVGYELIPPPRPGIFHIALSGSNLTLSGTNGLSTGVYYLLASTNLALPLNQWSSVATNALSANGDFTFTATNVVNPQAACQFYVLQLQ
jgi:hypothetical protein